MTLDQAIQHFLPPNMKGMKLDECRLTLEIYDRGKCYLSPKGLVIGHDDGSIYTAFFDESGVHAVEPTHKEYFINSNVEKFLDFLDIYLRLMRKSIAEEEAGNQEYTVEKVVEEINGGFSRLDSRAIDKDTFWFTIMDMLISEC